MNEKVLSVIRPTAFTSHYTVQLSDGSLQVRTVYTCPCCGSRRLVIWSDSDSHSLFSDFLFGSDDTSLYQSYCLHCRKGVGNIG